MVGVEGAFQVVDGMSNHVTRMTTTYSMPPPLSLSVTEQLLWSSPWLLGPKPMDIAPLIFEASSRKNWNLREALRDNPWIFKIKPSTIVSIQHIREFSMLWMLLHDLIQDDIVWKHMPSGHYSAASVYKAQFLGKILSLVEHMVWKVWAPPKVKLFAWLPSKIEIGP